jgi:hypothetical protein
MAGPYVEIRDVGKKITVAQSKQGWTNMELGDRLGISDDYVIRLKSGARRLTQKRFVKLCELLQPDEAAWRADLESFGKKLGYSRDEITTIIKASLPGVDFHSRIRSRTRLAQVFESIGGFWEVYYYSLAENRRIVARDICVIRKVNAERYIECQLWDGKKNYTGWGFPTVSNHLHFVFEKDPLYDETIVCLTNCPTQQTSKLYGVSLALSGPFDGRLLPAATKIVCNYLGKDWNLEKTWLARATYLTEKAMRKTAELRLIIPDISNEVQDKEVPYVLRVKKG